MSETARKDVNLAELSDDDILNMDPSSLEEPTDQDASETQEETPATETESEDLPEEGADTASEDIDDSESESAEFSPEDEEDEEEVAEQVDMPEIPDVRRDGDTEGEEITEDEVEDLTATDEDQAGDIDYEAEYNALMAPFKAAKREIKVNSIDDARRLMQMGVDYSRKMEAMKPYQKVLKTLERNDLLDIEKINFMIDLDKKNPEAIKKFLQDSKVDPMELDLEDDVRYKPTDHAPNDQELALEAVLDDIRDTPSFQKTVEEITGKWDNASKRVLLDQPDTIRVLNQHMGLGIYDQIMNVVEQERLFGRLVGMSDLEAYRVVGDAINAKGGFKPYLERGTSAKPSPQVSGSRSPKRDEQLRKRKQAASPTKAGSGAKSKEVENFLESFTDEEIEKMGPSIL